MTREQLLPPEVSAALPPLGATEGMSELVAEVKFFYPDFGWTWYGIEFDGEDMFFGLVDGDVPELGYFRLSELLENRGKLGCAIERDLYFEPTPVYQLTGEQESGGDEPVALIS